MDQIPGMTALLALRHCGDIQHHEAGLCHQMLTSPVSRDAESHVSTILSVLGWYGLTCVFPPGQNE